MHFPHALLLPLLLTALVLSGCGSYLQPFDVAPAHPGIEAVPVRALQQLPPPREKVVAAVYRFRDQTGQYKPSDGGASFSTAVTQGATTILLRVLDESGWFVPIEREGLSNLLNERKIIQSIRAQHEEADGTDLGPLPPLLYGGILLEGGIVGYDSNVLTGGFGARYFGIGGSGQFRQDQVTVYLRAVSTQSGRILKSVHTTKTILSQKLDTGAFLFVDRDRLFEAETGYSFNEPPVVAVTEAISEAVRMLIVEGAREGLWQPAAEAEAAMETLYASYEEEKTHAAQRDAFDRVQQRESRRGVGLGARAGAQRYRGDFRDPQARPSVEAFVHVPVARRWRVGLSATLGRVAALDVFDASSAAADVFVRYDVLPDARVTPFAFAGGGLRSVAPHRAAYGDDLFPEATGGVGLDVMLTSQLGLSVAGHTSYALHDKLDGAAYGRVHDSVWGLRAGLTLYLPVW